MKVGDEVKVLFDENDISVTKEMRQYDGMVTDIKDVHKTLKGKPQYILNGCVSSFGKPFFFTDEMLIPWDEESEEDV